MTVLGFSASLQETHPSALAADYVWCAWFSNGDYRREILPLGALVRVGA